MRKINIQFLFRIGGGSGHIYNDSHSLTQQVNHETVDGDPHVADIVEGSAVQSTGCTT